MIKIIISLLLGLLYFFMIQIHISKIPTQSKNFDFIINSKIDQEVNFHIKTDYNLTKLICNKKSVLLDHSKEHDYFYRGEEAIKISLNRGENRCEAVDMKPTIKQKMGFVDFFILFILSGIPLFWLLFLALIWTMNQIKTFNFSFSLAKNVKLNNSLYFKAIILIALLGVIIRVAYFQKYGIMNFQHDWHGHIEFIKYIAQHWSLPDIPMKGWEYPQQPLYYIITGAIYSFLMSIGFSDQDALHGLGYFSLFCSVIFLYFSYRLMALLTTDRWVQLVAMIFISLTPSLVYLSARINNDALVMVLSVMAIYYTVKSFKSKFQTHFYLALITVSLLFLTKLSTAGVELLFFSLLLIRYYYAPKEREKVLQNRLYLYGLVGIFLLSSTLLRLYLPLDDGSFYLVNGAKFPNQIIEPLDFSYFASFNIMDLVTMGQSHVFGEDSIRYSFLTYQYGTMFFGEFDYAYFTNRSEYLHLSMQVILFLGLIYLIGFIAYLINLRHEPLLHKVLFGLLLFNLISIIKLIYIYPSVCHTDFRFFVSSFVLLAFMFARGLGYLSFNKIVRNIISGVLGLLVVSELMFFWFLIV